MTWEPSSCAPSTRFRCRAECRREQGGTATVVRHGYDSWFTGWHPPADESWKIVERAEFLLKLQPRLPYNLIGHNCEIIANMCVSGGWTESYQARRYFTVRAVMDAALSLDCRQGMHEAANHRHG